MTHQTPYALPPADILYLVAACAVLAAMSLAGNAGILGCEWLVLASPMRAAPAAPAGLLFPAAGLPFPCNPRIQNGRSTRLR